MNKLITTLALALGLATSAGAQTTTFGDSDCGEWLSAPSAAKKAWVLGYLTGINEMHQLSRLEPPDPLDAMNSADQAYVWLDNYCRQNPLERVRSGARDLYTELARRKAVR